MSHPARIEEATEGIEDDPLIAARRAGVEAAQAREDAPGPIDEFQLRVGQDFIDDHDVRVLARIPLKRPHEIRAQREVLRAETEMAISRLEQASLDRRTELCFPSVDALVHEERVRIYDAYAGRQAQLLMWNEDWRRSGMMDELRGARFELESKTHLAIWRPTPVRTPEQILAVLPPIGEESGRLVLDPDALRQTVDRHHPSVELRRATAERYHALAEREQARRLPWLRFVDVAYDYTSDKGGESGVGGKVAFTIPLGGKQKANRSRYDLLARQEKSLAAAVVNEQMERSVDALLALRAFEAEADRLRELEELATRAEGIADQWRSARLAEPPAVSALLDEAFAARSAILDARERAATARCTLLGMTGVPADHWPRESRE